MLIKEREMFVKEGMIFINRQRPIEVSRIIGGGEPLKTCNELGSRAVRHFSSTHPTSQNRVIGNPSFECLMILILTMRPAKKKESENSILV
jgi:hypothetical protein